MNQRMTQWIACLPMYNVTPAHTAAWRALLDATLTRLAAAGGPATACVSVLDEAPADLMALWRRDNLLLSQTCGYPYRMRGLADQTRLVATPVFDVEGCEGAHYRSAIVVSARAWAMGVTTLEACRGLRAAINDTASHSGMNALRRVVAPLARDGSFFTSVLETGGHLKSIDALTDGRAEIAAIDCVTWAYANEGVPARTEGVRVIGWTDSAPGLPLIASARVDDATLTQLRDALDDARKSGPYARALHLKGFAAPDTHDYADIARFEHEAAALGYPRLA